MHTGAVKCVGSVHQTRHCAQDGSTVVNATVRSWVSVPHVRINSDDTRGRGGETEGAEGANRYSGEGEVVMMRGDGGM